MPNKTARLTLLITPQMKQALQALALTLESTPSQVVRLLIRDRLTRQDSAPAAEPRRRSPTKQSTD